MSAEISFPQPLVSVVIPCYNHGRYLQEAIDSVRQQQYEAVEILIVDDGSTDNSKTVAAQNAGVIYIYQQNAGLSAARNTGIRNSTGELLLFLDADDWLLPGALATNVAYLLQNPALAFVSGGHEKVFLPEGRTEDETAPASGNYFELLLQGNYIGMHATVLYRRWVFNDVLFDESLRACEDYDLYLKVARRHPVLHHTQKIAAYRIHQNNMSGNIPLMLKHVLQVLARQRPYLRTAGERKALLTGLRNWKEYYGNKLLQNIVAAKPQLSAKAFFTLLRIQPRLGARYISKNRTVIKTIIKKNLPAFSLRWLHQAGIYQKFKPAVGKVAGGDFDRLTPFSTEFGYDRGGPVDRYYIENFLRREAAHIQGRVLEIGDNEYTLLFGGDRVAQSDILHVDASNEKASFVGDLADAPQLPDNSFDCIILTQTLHLIYEYKNALKTCYRILKPGGTLLLTSPGITPMDHGEWNDTWLWAFTDNAFKKLMPETFPGGKFNIEIFGNVYVATAFLYGMGQGELSREKIDHQDPHFQVIITVKAQKQPV